MSADTVYVAVEDTLVAGPFDLPEERPAAEDAYVQHSVEHEDTGNEVMLLFRAGGGA